MEVAYEFFKLLMFGSAGLVGLGVVAWVVKLVFTQLWAE